MISRRKMFAALLGAPLAIVALARPTAAAPAVVERTLLVKFKIDTSSVARFEESVLRAIENANRRGRIA